MLQGGCGNAPNGGCDEFTRSRIQVPRLMMFKIRHGDGIMSDIGRAATRNVTRSGSTPMSLARPPNVTAAVAHAGVSVGVLRVKRVWHPRRVEVGTSMTMRRLSVAKITSVVSRWCGTTKSGKSVWERRHGVQNPCHTQMRSIPVVMAQKPVVAALGG